MCLSRNHDLVTQDNLPPSCELFGVGSTSFLLEMKILPVDFMVALVDCNAVRKYMKTVYNKVVDYLE